MRLCLFSNVKSRSRYIYQNNKVLRDRKKRIAYLAGGGGGGGGSHALSGSEGVPLSCLGGNPSPP